MCTLTAKTTNFTTTTTATTASSTTSTATTTQILDIEDLHKHAVLSKSNTYIDPATGFTVFTEYAHLKRGKCCGNLCRHCPYGWEEVEYRNEKGQMMRKTPKVRSGKKEAVKALLDKIDTGDYFKTKELDDEDDDESDDEEERCGCSHEELKCDENTESPTEKVDQEATIIHKPAKTGGRHGGKHTSKNVPYTRTGDAGTSVLLTGERRRKDDDAFEAMGTVDELCSVVGVVHAELMNIADAPEEYAELEDWLLDVMSRLFDIGSHVAKPKKQIDDDGDDDQEGKGAAPIFTADGVGNGFDIEHVNTLEEWIDVMTDQLPELTSFILPSGSKASAQLHVARCVCRRAERRVLPLVREGVCDPNALKYLNRLSDFLFTAARWSNFCDGREETQYRRPIRGAKQRNRVTVSLREEKKEGR